MMIADAQRMPLLEADNAPMAAVQQVVANNNAVIAK
jgi:hypothetical protein